MSRPKSIALVAGGYPPDLDGIGDYTFWLAKAIAERTDVSPPVTVYTRKGEHEVAPAVRVVPFFEFARPSSIRDVVALVAKDRPDWLVLQYNPFCWGARGFCPALPPTLRRLKKLPAAPRLAVMFHETTVPAWPWRLAIMYSWQRPILRRVVDQADRIFVSTKRWIPELVSAGSKVPATLSPAGSNIPRSSITKKLARLQLGIPDDVIVLGVFGGAHPSRLTDWISEAALAVQQTGRRILLLHIGPEGDVLQKAAQRIPFRSLGILPAGKVAEALRSADCLVSPFVDGISTRRTSAIAAICNGIPVATTRRAWTDEWFLAAADKSVLVSSAESKEQFGHQVAGWVKPLDPIRSREIEAMHDDFFAWNKIAAGILEGLS